LSINYFIKEGGGGEGDRERERERERQGTGGWRWIFKRFKFFSKKKLLI
jgi:hypothetical protein